MCENYTIMVTFTILLAKWQNAAGLKIGYDGKIKFRYSKSKGIVTDLSIKRLLRLLNIDEPVTMLYNMTKSEMFEKIVKSKFFKKSYFDLSNLNSRSRKRQLKRPTYMEFLEYIKDIDDSENEYIHVEFETTQKTVDDMLEHQATIMTNRIVRDKYNAVEICKYLHNVDPTTYLIVSEDNHYQIMRECSKISEEIRETILQNLTRYMKCVNNKMIDKLIAEEENVKYCKMFFGDVLDFMYLGYNGVDHNNPFGMNFKDAYDECWIFNKFGKKENLPLSLAFELGIFDKTVNASMLCEVEK